MRILLLLIIMVTLSARAQVAINTDGSSPDASAILDVKSTTKGFLPPRMSTEQRNGISSPVAGLVIFNASENVLNVFNGTGWTSLVPVTPFACGLSVTVNHLASRGVAPVNKTVTYGTVSGLPGEPSKCWITQNLGANRQATASYDATEASAGWYWQFNRKQGYKHDGTTLTPNSEWITMINENSHWVAANDPCTLELGPEWRLPTFSEWNLVENWADLNVAWNSVLNLHAAGLLNSSTGALSSRGSGGSYWSSSQFDSDEGYRLSLSSSLSIVNNTSKAWGNSIRCLRDI